MQIRTIPMEQWCALARENVAPPVTICLEGESMRPLIRKGRDPVTIVPVRGEMKKGDVVLFQPAMKGDSVRKLADAVAKRCGGLAAVFAGEDGQYAYALLRADGQDISPLVKELNKALNGRGGGRSGFAQGSIQADQAAIEAFFGK